MSSGGWAGTAGLSSQTRCCRDSHWGCLTSFPTRELVSGPAAVGLCAFPNDKLLEAMRLRDPFTNPPWESAAVSPGNSHGRGGYSVRGAQEDRAEPQLRSN